MGVYKRYIVIVAAVIIAIFVDTVIYTGILGVPYAAVPSLYHIGNILMLACAFAVLGDAIFKAGILR